MDQRARLQEQVREAFQQSRPLQIQGPGPSAFTAEKLLMRNRCYCGSIKGLWITNPVNCL
jgi:hypothetical protein